MSHHDHSSHHHHEGHSSLCRQIVLIVISALLLAAAIVIEKTGRLSLLQMLLVYLVPYILIGSGTIKEAAEGLSKGEIFNEHFLMTIATGGALAIGFLPDSEPEFAEAVFVMLFFQVGELFESYAEGQSRRSIAHLVNIRPDTANVERNGQVASVTPDKVDVGEVIIIRPGEKIPLDGIVVEGYSRLNTSALTGESMPRTVSAGDEVISGCVNMSGLLKVRTTKSFSESTVSKILDIVEDAAEHKSQSENFITRFARIYTPIVVFAAIAIAFIPPIVSGHGSILDVEWLHRALMFLVVSCPCALVLSVPLTFFGGIGGASRCGILVKGSNYLDVLSKVTTVVFDKTGTLTYGKFSVSAVHPDIVDERHLLHLAAHVEHYSTHPIGAALREAFPEEATDGCHITDVKEIAGQGICAKVEDMTICVGNTKLMDSVGAHWHECQHEGTIIHVAISSAATNAVSEGHQDKGFEYAGHIIISDNIKDDSAEAINDLRNIGVKNVVMLTGDRKEVADSVAHQLHLDAWHSELLPTDKVTHLQSILADKPSNEYLAFVGDGINDAPVLASADVGIAMGALGSDAAIEAADVVLMDDKTTKIATAIRIARRTLRIASQNVWGAIGVKVAVLILATFGLATMPMAVFADVGVTVLAVLNATRALRTA